MTSHRRWPTTLLVVAVALIGCGDEGIDAADKSPASTDGSITQMAATIERELTDNGEISEAQAACVAEGVTRQLSLEELESIGVTTAGFDAATMADRSFQLDPASVDYWDTFFECIPEANRVGVGPGSETSPSALECLQRRIGDDKLLRLTLVFGSTVGGVSVGATPVEEQLQSALSDCGVKD